MKSKYFLYALLLLIFISTVCQAAEPTTSVRLIKYAQNTSVINETTVSYQWMEENLPVHGDGITHYYHQGPVFESDKWDPNETVNFKDKGAVKGTNIRDLCDLIGGVFPGDEVMIKAVDGYHVEFGYENIYNPQSRQGPLVLCWYDSETGYPPDFYMGMRLVFFSDDNVFGNWDMHECLPEKSQHFFGDLSPSTSGLSIRWVDEIGIYTGGYTGDRGSPAKSMPVSTAQPNPISGFSALSVIAGLLMVIVISRNGSK